MTRNLLRSILTLLTLASLLLMMGCSVPDAPAGDASDTVPAWLDTLLAPLTPAAAPEDVAAYEQQRFGSSDCTRETYANGNLAVTYGDSARKYVFAGNALHSIYFYGTQNFPAGTDTITEAVGQPETETGDTYALWNADFGGVPATIVFTANPVNPARTYLVIELPH